MSNGHGGARVGAGRPNILGKGYQGKRSKVSKYQLLGIELRIRDDVPSLKNQQCIKIIQEAIRYSKQFRFRVIHYSILKNEIHLLCETENNETLNSGMKCLTIRMAKNINTYCSKKFYPRKGSLFFGRYKIQQLKNLAEYKLYIKRILNLPRIKLKDKVKANRYSSFITIKNWKKYLKHFGLKPQRDHQPLINYTEQEILNARNCLSAPVNTKYFNH